jgi:hypothetical protein
VQWASDLPCRLLYVTFGQLFNIAAAHRIRLQLQRVVCDNLVAECAVAAAIGCCCVTYAGVRNCRGYISSKQSRLKDKGQCSSFYPKPLITITTSFLQATYSYQQQWHCINSTPHVCSKPGGHKYLNTRSLTTQGNVAADQTPLLNASATLPPHHPCVSRCAGRPERAAHWAGAGGGGQTS